METDKFLCSMETIKFYAGNFILNFITTMQYGNLKFYQDKFYYNYVVWKLLNFYVVWKLINFILNFIITMQYGNS